MKTIKRFAALSATCALFVLSAVPAQAITNAPVPVANYITFGGLDWAWANPCAPYQPSCGVVDMSYQATQGWRFPTLAEFLARPAAADFGVSGNFKCAAAYFSTAYSHCDYNDAVTGYIFDYGYGVLGAKGADSASETWVVRGAAAPAVPEPASWAMMIGGLGIAGAALRRRATKISFA